MEVAPPLKQCLLSAYTDYTLSKVVISGPLLAVASVKFERPLFIKRGVYGPTLRHKPCDGTKIKCQTFQYSHSNFIYM